MLGLYISTVILGIQAMLEPDRNAVKGIAAQKKQLQQYIIHLPSRQVRD